MSRRKNIAIRDLIDLVNRKNRISFCSPETRAGWNSLLDEVLHNANVYRGFRYLSADEVPAGHLPGIVEEWVSDFDTGGDCDTLPWKITSEDIKEALLEMLTSKGREDYRSGALAEFAIEFAEVNGLEPGQPLPEDDLYDEMPFAVVLIEVSKD